MLIVDTALLGADALSRAIRDGKKLLPYYIDYDLLCHGYIPFEILYFCCGSSAYATDTIAD